MEDDPGDWITPAAPPAPAAADPGDWVTPSASAAPDHYHQDIAPTFGATMNSMVPFGKDVAAAGSAAGKATADLIHGRPTSFGQDFTGYRQAETDASDQYIRDHPILGRVAEGLGLISGMAVPEGGAASAVAPSLLSRTAQGAGVGAIYGAGTSDGDLADRATATSEGAIGGGIIGAAAPAVIKGVSKAAGWAGDQLRNIAAPFTDSGRQDIAGNVLRNIATGQPPAMEPAPLSGMTPTAGQASNDPGILFAERAAQNKSPDAVAMAKAAQTNNNQAIRGAITQTGDTSMGDSVSQIMADRLTAAQQTGRTAVRQAWEKAGLDDAQPLPAAPVKQAVADYLDGLVPIERTKIPLDWLNAVENLGGKEGDANFGTTNLKEMQALRADIGDAERSAYRSGNNNQARIVGGLSDIMQEHTENPDLIGAANVNPEYQAARQATRDFKQTFNQPGPVRNVLGVDRYGADKIPVSATADTFIRSGKGAPEALQSYLKAVGNDPDALDAARSAFAQKFLSTVENAGLDQNGDKLISAPKVSNFLDDYSHVVNSRLFTPDQRALMSNIQGGADMAARTARGAPPAGGSDTVAKLYGDRYIDALIGKWPSRALVGTAGYIAGHATGIPGAGMIGAMTGTASSDVLSQALYRAPREKVVAIVNQALHDPALASSLMSRASPGATKTMLPASRSYLSSVLSGPIGGAIGRVGAPLQTPASQTQQTQ